VRILLACPYDWFAAGGVQVHVRELARGLADRGHDVLVIAPGSRTGSTGDVRIVGGPVRIPYGGKVAPICFSRSSWRRVREWLRVFEPEIVHAHEPLSPSTSMLAVLAAAAPVVATFHAFHERSRLLRVAAPALRSVAARIDAAIAVSQAAAGFLAPVVRGPIEVVPNGVDVDRFAQARGSAPRGEGRVALWVSRLDPQKGFGVAVRAFETLAERFTDLRLVVAGDGRDRDLVERLPDPVRRRVTMLGPVPNVDLPDLLAAADVFLAPATGHESFGIVLVEAMAAGVPVVATDIAGYREVVRAGVDGLLVPPNDPGAIAEAASRVLGDPALAASLSAAGRERSRAFSWDAVIPRLESVYGRVLASAR
jgi:phosphatidylinositol alpha-mannosyltransferase